LHFSSKQYFKAVAVVIVCMPSLSVASPNVPLNDPRYDDLEDQLAARPSTDDSSDFLPLSEGRLGRLAGNDTVWPRIWFEPIGRASVDFALHRVLSRPFSTTSHSRDLAGGITISCEHHEAPCADGAGVSVSLESSVGYRDIVSATVRPHVSFGTNDFSTAVSLTRAYALAELSYFALEVGRDVLVIGPSARTHLSWSNESTPIDHIRVSNPEPIRIGSLRLHGTYALGELREPQTFPGTLASIARVQAGYRHLDVGLVQLLQFEGAGAPHLGIIDSLLEHVRRGDSSAGTTDTSNRRFGGDISLRIPELSRLRLYYELMFEDIRKRRLIDALRYDADHLVGVEVHASNSRLRSVLVELLETGFRSHEHTQRVTGFTNAERPVGAPLGPDAFALSTRAQIQVSNLRITPWFEYARLHSDTYEFLVDGPINPVSEGVVEHRYRFGTNAEMPVGPTFLSVEAFVERIESLSFTPGASHTNAGVELAITWRPHDHVAKLALH
jgi:hypothetical protein